MGYFRPGWEQGLSILDDWWFWSCQYLYQDGDCELPGDYQRWTRELVDFVRDVAKQDPTPLWNVGRLIREHAQIGNQIGWEPVAMHEIWNAIDCAYIYKDWLWKQGTTDAKGQKRGRPKKPHTIDVEKYLANGLKADDIQDLTGLDISLIHQIASRTRRKS